MSSVVSFFAVLTSSYSDSLNSHRYTKTRSGILDSKTQTGMIPVQTPIEAQTIDISLLYL